MVSKEAVCLKILSSLHTRSEASDAQGDLGHFLRTSYPTQMHRDSLHREIVAFLNGLPGSDAAPRHNILEACAWGGSFSCQYLTLGHCTIAW